MTQAEHFSFQSPIFLLGLLFVVVGALYLRWRKKRQKNAALSFSSTAWAKELPPSLWAKLSWLPDALLLLSLCLWVVGLARPQLVGQAEADDSRGIDIVVAVDTSGSMRAVDFEPRDRMFVAKRSIAEFIKTRSSDRIGLVPFAGEAASWVPLTLDYSLLLKMLDEVQVDMLPDGTAIGSALGTALNRLRQSDASSRVIVLLTDGDNNSGEISPLQAADFAKKLGVKIYTILIGKGGMVPFPAGKDLFGRQVLQQRQLPVNPELLEQIAEETGGHAYVAKDGKELDARLAEVLNQLDTSRLEAPVYSAPRRELFSYFVLAGAIFLAISAGLSATKMRSFV